MLFRSLTPARSPEVGGAPPTGKFSQSTRFEYSPSKGTKKATFRVVLKDAVTGRVAAVSDPETIAIPDVC